MSGHIRKAAAAMLGTAALVAFVALSGPALAHGNGGGGGGFGGGFGGPAGPADPGGFGGFGGNSAGHISAQGAANTNGPNSPDRVFGLDRARDRMNAHGLNHNHAPDSTPGAP